MVPGSLKLPPRHLGMGISCENPASLCGIFQDHSVQRTFFSLLGTGHSAIVIKALNIHLFSFGVELSALVQAPIGHKAHSPIQSLLHQGIQGKAHIS